MQFHRMQANMSLEAQQGTGSAVHTFSFILSRASAADGVVPLGELMLLPALCLALPGVHSVCMQHFFSRLLQ